MLFRSGQHVIDGVIGPDSYRTYYGPDYDKQGAPAPEKPSNPDNDTGQIIIE